MWQYNYSDELYHRFHKYLDKHMDRKGRWVYEYERKDGSKVTNTRKWNDTHTDVQPRYSTTSTNKKVKQYNTYVDLEDNMSFASRLRLENSKRTTDSLDGSVTNFFDYNTGRKVSDFTINSRALIKRGKVAASLLANKLNAKKEQIAAAAHKGKNFLSKLFRRG